MRISVKVGILRRGWVTMSADFRGKGASPTNHYWCQKTRVIAILCGIKISAVHHLVLSQYTHLTDGWTDRRTEFRQQHCALHYMQSHSKHQWHCYDSKSVGGHFTWTTDVAHHCNQIRNLTLSARHLNQTYKWLYNNQKFHTLTNKVVQVQKNCELFCSDSSSAGLWHCPM